MSKEEIEEIIVVTNKEKPVEQKEGMRVVDVESEEGQKLIDGVVSEEALPLAFMVMRRVRKCNIVQEEGKVVAKCELGDVALGKAEVSKIKSEAETTPPPDEECPGCSEAIAIGWALNYIKPLNDLIANKILNDVTDEKMSPDEAMDKCIVVAQQHGKHELVGTLTHLKKIMHQPVSELEKEAKSLG